MLFSRTEAHFGTIVSISLYSDTPQGTAILDAIFLFFSSFEAEFSRFLPDSALSKLNREKFLQPSYRFFQLMQFCKEKYESTQRYCNPLVQVSRMGYVNSFEKPEKIVVSQKPNLEFQDILFSQEALYLTADQVLDFWWIGKGYAVDIAAHMLLNFWCMNFFVNAGGDIRANGLNPAWKPWNIGLENPFTQKIDGGIRVWNGSIATSGRQKRKWSVDEKEYHHLIHPFTHENHDMHMSVTVVWESCGDCDAFTKVLFHAPIQEGFALLRQHGLEGCVYTAHGTFQHSAWFKNFFSF
jgi:FAD:protein FMN transferase